MDASFDQYFLMIAVGWLVLQAMALWKLRGWWRFAAWVPLVAIGCAIAVAALGVLAGSDLAPIWVFLALPLCLLWIGALWTLRAAAWALGLQAGHQGGDD